MQNLVPIIIVIVAILVVAFLQGRLNKIYDYQCGKCGNRFSLSTWTATLAPHMMGKKLVRCPRCGNLGWATRVLNK